MEQITLSMANSLTRLNLARMSCLTDQMLENIAKNTPNLTRLSIDHNLCLSLGVFSLAYFYSLLLISFLTLIQTTSVSPSFLLPPALCLHSLSCSFLFTYLSSCYPSRLFLHLSFWWYAKKGIWKSSAPLEKIEKNESFRQQIWVPSFSENSVGMANYNHEFICL